MATASGKVAATPAGPLDGPAIEAFITGLSASARYLRFLYTMRSPSAELIKVLTQFDPPRQAALLAFSIDQPGELVGIAQYSASFEPATCEAAVVVADAWQRQGIATFLLRELARVARFGGFRRASASIASENRAALALARRWGATIAIAPGNAQLTEITATLDHRLIERRRAERTILSSRRSALPGARIY